MAKNNIGSVLIAPNTTGNIKIGDVLTAKVTDIDGVPPYVYKLAGSVKYTWFYDNTPISNYTNPTYTVTEDLLGKNITVKATYTDNLKNLENVLSPVLFIPKNTKGTVVISDTTNLIVGNKLNTSVTDADGISGNLKYQWFSDDVAISKATDSSYTLGLLDVGKKISVQASYVDNLKTSEIVKSSQTEKVIPPSNNIGSISIDSGSPIKIGDKLTANIKDLDNVNGQSIKIQWFRDNQEIPKETAKIHVLTPDDLGKKISVQANYIDGKTNQESVSSSVDIPQNDTGKVVLVLKSNIPLNSSGSTNNRFIQSNSGDVYAKDVLKFYFGGDSDGTSSKTKFSYEWFRDGKTTFNKTDSFTANNADVNHLIRLKVNYVDDLNHKESVLSPAVLICDYEGKVAAGHTTNGVLVIENSDLLTLTGQVTGNL